MALYEGPVRFTVVSHCPTSLGVGVADGRAGDSAIQLCLSTGASQTALHHTIGRTTRRSRLRLVLRVLPQSPTTRLRHARLVSISYHLLDVTFDLALVLALLQQNRLRWYGHVLRKEDDDWVKICMEYE